MGRAARTQQMGRGGRCILKRGLISGQIPHQLSETAPWRSSDGSAARVPRGNSFEARSEALRSSASISESEQPWIATSLYTVRTYVIPV